MVLSLISEDPLYCFPCGCTDIRTSRVQGSPFSESSPERTPREQAASAVQDEVARALAAEKWMVPTATSVVGEDNGNDSRTLENRF